MSITGKNLRIIGVSRGNEYSPNHVGNDAAIFQAVAVELEKKGCEVVIYPEKDFVAQEIEADFIFDMARDRATIKRLQELEKTGKVVINSAFGIDNCVRKPMTELLMQHQVPHPESYIIPTDGPFTPNVFPCWIKRGNSHAMVKEDVVYVEC